MFNCYNSQNNHPSTSDSLQRRGMFAVQNALREVYNYSLGSRRSSPSTLTTCERSIWIARSYDSPSTGEWPTLVQGRRKKMSTIGTMLLFFLSFIDNSFESKLSAIDECMIRKSQDEEKLLRPLAVDYLLQVVNVW